MDSVVNYQNSIPVYSFPDGTVEPMSSAGWYILQNAN